MVALGHAVEHLGRRLERKLDLDHTAHIAAADLETGVAEDAQHGCVLGQDLRDEAVDACTARMRGQPFQQTACDAAVLELVGHDERDLGARWIAQANPCPQPDHAHGAVGIDQLADQRQALVAVAAQERRDQMRVDSDGSLEAEVTALGRQALEEFEQRLFVGRARRAKSQCRAVPEYDVFPVCDRKHSATLAETGRESIRRRPCQQCGELPIHPGLRPDSMRTPTRHDPGVDLKRRRTR